MGAGIGNVSLHFVDWFLVGIYFVGMFYIGVWSYRKVQELEDYLVAGRALTLPILVGTLILDGLILLRNVFFCRCGVHVFRGHLGGYLLLSPLLYIDDLDELLFDDPVAGSRRSFLARCS